MQFTGLDWLVLFLYLGGVAVFGYWMGGAQRSAKDYFLSEEKISWLKVAMAIVATETSAVTFISVPGIAFKGYWSFLQLAFGYIVGRVAVSYLFLPKYFEGELTTAYALIEKRFGVDVRKLSAVTFIITRLFADGVRLFVTAIPLALIFRGYKLFEGISDSEIYIASILISALVTLFYVVLGGIRAVIWTDIIQLVIYLLGAAVAIVILFEKIPNPTESLHLLNEAGKFSIFDFSLNSIFTSPYNFFSAFIGGGIFAMASHGTDYIIVQRLFTTGTLSESRKALIASGVMVAVQFALFLFIGSLLYAFYGNLTIRTDEIFPKFIIEYVPSGFAGLIIAGLLAAAMSTLSGSISAISSSTVYDLYANSKWGSTKSEAEKLSLSKKVSLIWTAILTLSAISFLGMQQSVVEVALSIASFTYGGLLGLFLLAVMKKRFSSISVAIGFAASILVMIYIIKFTPLAWTTYTVIGSATTVFTTYLWNFVAFKTQSRK
ncbi:MAG: sodium:solute symporter [Chloroherpetonaceae bacterium]|nr:sodium:solute symporter [Chloroherpetonaceae bacterium]